MVGPHRSQDKSGGYLRSLPSPSPVAASLASFTFSLASCTFSLPAACEVESVWEMYRHRQRGEKRERADGPTRDGVS